MKAKLYTFITGLLMAACITSYGQEIVNQFVIQEEGSYTIGCDLQENKDGTLFIGTVSCNNPYLYDPEYLIHKTTPEGETLASLHIPVSEGMNGQFFTSITDNQNRHFLFRKVSATDSYIVTNFCWDLADNHYFRMVSIDADLNVDDDIAVQVAQVPHNTFKWDKCLIDTNNDFIISFWIDETFNMMRIGLDGTIKTSLETTELFPPQFDYGYHPDTMLWYSGFGILKDTPLTYYKLGGYETESEEYPVFCYFFDEDFNIIETHWFDSYNEDILFSGGNLEHFVPFDENTYLIASEMEYPNGNAGSALLKYDMNHNPICISPELGTSGYPLETEIAGNNIYQCYINFGYTWTVSLACLDNDLNLTWDLELPGLPFSGLYGNSIITKPNGDIIVGFGSSDSYNINNTRIFVYTVRNTPANISETTNSNLPFTLYPNPVKDQLTLRFDDGTEPESVELYDFAGRLVGTKQNGIESIDMSAMPSRVFLLRIMLKDGTSYLEKIVKE